MKKLLLLFCLGFWTSSCSMRTRSNSELMNNSGIWSTAENLSVSWQDLMTRLEKADVILVGESHDNPEHHRLQALILDYFSNDPRGLVVGFEHFRSDNQTVLDGALDLDPPSLDDFRKQVDWDHSGWPDWKIFQPLFEVALRIDAKWVALDLSKNQITDLKNGKWSDFPRGFGSKYKLLNPLPKDLESKLNDDIREAHCGHFGGPYMSKVLLIQRSRDAWMAHRLVQATKTRKRIAFVGGGHARKDYGMPYYLRTVSPQLHVASVGLIEEGSDRDSSQIFDYTIQTSRISRPDPCEIFRKNPMKKSN